MPAAGAKAMGTTGVGLGSSNQRAWGACGGVRSFKCQQLETCAFISSVN